MALASGIWAVAGEPARTALRQHFGWLPPILAAPNQVGSDPYEGET